MQTYAPSRSAKPVSSRASRQVSPIGVDNGSRSRSLRPGSGLHISAERAEHTKGADTASRQPKDYGDRSGSVAAKGRSACHTGGDTVCVETALRRQAGHPEPDRSDIEPIKSAIIHI